MPTTRTDEVQEALDRCFPDVPAQAVAAFRDAARLTRYAGEQVVCTQGAHEDRFGVVVRGELDVWMDEAGGRTFVATLGPGRSLGGLEYVTGSPRVADAVAASPLTLLELSFAELDAVVAEDPALLRAISREVVGELLASQGRFIDLSAAGGPEPGARVFLSYARADAAFAAQLARGLRRLGVDVWVDVDSITAGKSWARQVGEALDTCWAMVLVLSPASLASENSDDEWNFYLDKQKPVFPVLLEAVDVPYRLNKLQYVDFTAQPFDRALTKLVVALRRASTRRAEAPAPVSPPAAGRAPRPRAPRRSTPAR